MTNLFTVVWMQIDLDMYTSRGMFLGSYSNPKGHCDTQ